MTKKLSKQRQKEKKKAKRQAKKVPLADEMGKEVGGDDDGDGSGRRGSTASSPSPPPPPASEEAVHEQTPTLVCLPLTRYKMYGCRRKAKTTSNLLRRRSQSHSSLPRKRSSWYVHYLSCLIVLSFLQEDRVPIVIVATEPSAFVPPLSSLPQISPSVNGKQRRQNRRSRHESKPIGGGTGSMSGVGARPLSKTSPVNADSEWNKAGLSRRPRPSNAGQVISFSLHLN
jgi:hypothetical protein